MSISTDERSGTMRSKLFWGLLWVATLGIAFGAARLTVSEPERTDPVDAELLNAALAEREELRRTYLLSTFLQQLEAEDLPGALEALEAPGVDLSPDEMRLFMLAWSRFDAPGAYAWARDWPTGRRHALMRAATHAWGFRDGPAAMAALEGVRDAERRAQLEEALFDGWLRSDDRAGAGPYIALLRDPMRRRRLTAVLAAETLRAGPEALMDWVEQVPEDAPHDFKQLAFVQAAGLLAREDPTRATAWFEKHREGSYSVGSIGVIARRWAAHHDRKELFAWLRALPADGARADERSDAIGTAFRVWLREDDAAARAWLDSMLPDPALDPAVAALVLRLSGSTPESAIAWAGRIEDEDLRRRSQVRVARGWLRADREAALAWLEASDLGDDLRQKIVGRPRAARVPTLRVEAAPGASPEPR